MTDTTITLDDDPSGAEPHVADQAIAAVEAQEGQPAALPDISTMSIDDMLKLPAGQLTELAAREAPGSVQAGEPVTAPGAAPAAPPVPEVQTGTPVNPNAPAAPEKMVPVSALMAERQKRQVLEADMQKVRETAAFYAGKSQAGTPGVQTGQPVNPLQDIDSKIQAVEAASDKRITALAEKFDLGEMTLVEFKKLEREEQKKLDELQGLLWQRRDKIVAELNAPTPDQITSDPRLVTETQKLMANNPWVDQLTDDDYQALRALAVHTLTSRGIPVTETPEGYWNVRLAIVETGRQYGFDQRVQAPGAPAPAAPPATQPAPGAKAPVPVQQPTAQQRLDKLTLAAAHPPQPTQAGTSLPVSLPAASGMNETMGVDEMLRAIPLSALKELVGDK